jgi:hypothetical protein
MAMADTAATSGHVDDNDSDKQDSDDVNQNEDKVDTMTTRQRATHQDEHDDDKGRYYGGRHNDDRDGWHDVAA